MQKQKRKINSQAGAAMLVSIVFFLFISLSIIAGLVSPSVREFKNANVNLNSKKSYFLAESGSEDAFYRILRNKTIGTSETITLDSNTTTTDITSIGSDTMQIVSLGDVSNYQRQTKITLSTSAGVSFNYGVLVGQGGVYLDSGIVNGNLYANGPITASSSGSNLISGTAISANSPALVSDQTNGIGTPAYNVVFGNANSTQDIAQSFQVSTESPINKIQLYIKKTSTPSNATVKIVNDASGNPGTTILASGTLSASAVTTSYGWINVAFTSNPLLTVGTTYWLVVDASTSNNKYYIIGASNGGYANGLGKIGQSGGTWNNTTPSGLDYYFSIFLGGINGLISGVSQWNQLHIGTESDTAQAHTVNYANVAGDIYCQEGTGNNKSCISQADPSYTDFPVSDANIDQWKADASSTDDTYTGNLVVGSSGASFGPRIITGNLTVSSGGTLTITGTIWVKGNLVLSGGSLTKLASSYGSNDGVILVDGTISISGGAKAVGTGPAGGYLMLLSQSNSSSAMSISGDAGALIAYAPYGTISITGGSAVKAVTGYKLILTGNSSISYEDGLKNNNFSSGPSGTWAVEDWGEQ
ncbi:MAG: choice-of-anchor R domain-containing protein [Candidatus Paceibacterota bacterium]|jgi:hypothetical protein